MIKLKPCPFCSGETVRMSNLDTNRAYYFGCSKCCCLTSFAAKSEKDAIEAWNTRAQRTCHMPEIAYDRGFIKSYDTAPVRYCDKCGEQILAKPANYCPNCGAKVIDE